MADNKIGEWDAIINCEPFSAILAICMNNVNCFCGDNAKGSQVTAQ